MAAGHDAGPDAVALAPTATEARRRLTAVVERAAGEWPQPDHDHQQQA